MIQVNDNFNNPDLEEIIQTFPEDSQENIQNIKISPESPEKVVQDINEESSDYKKNFRRCLPYEIISLLQKTREIWVSFQKQTFYLRRLYGYGMFVLLVVQLVFLGVVMWRLISEKNPSIYFGFGFGSYAIGMIAQMIFIPKIIAQHLFPQKQINQINEILKLAIKYENNYGWLNDDKQII